MGKISKSVRKADIGFMDKVKGHLQGLGGKMRISGSRSVSTIKGYGLTITRETESLTAGVEKDCDDEG